MYAGGGALLKKKKENVCRKFSSFNNKISNPFKFLGEKK